MTTIGRRTIILKEVPRSLQVRLKAASTVCPLCSTTMPARGLRPKPDPGLPVERWEVVFTCPACGLITTFDAQHVSPRLLKAIQGTQWATQLRQHLAKGPAKEGRRERETSRYHFFSVFVFSFLTWIILTGSFKWIDLLWGSVASLIVARFSYRLVAFEIPHWISSPKRWGAFFLLIFEFLRQLIKQNISLSIRVLRPRLKINPGIVVVPTRLMNDIELTLLGSMMTLTPDTIVMDIDQEDGLLYVHWIDVKTTDPEEVREMILTDLEEKMIRWLK